MLSNANRKLQEKNNRKIMIITVNKKLHITRNSLRVTGAFTL